MSLLTDHNKHMFKNPDMLIPAIWLFDKDLGLRDDANRGQKSVLTGICFILNRNPNMTLAELILTHPYSLGYVMSTRKKTVIEEQLQKLGYEFVKDDTLHSKIMGNPIIEVLDLGGLTIPDKQSVFQRLRAPSHAMSCIPVPSSTPPSPY